MLLGCLVGCLFGWLVNWLFGVDEDDFNGDNDNYIVVTVVTLLYNLHVAWFLYVFFYLTVYLLLPFCVLLAATCFNFYATNLFNTLCCALFVALCISSKFA